MPRLARWMLCRASQCITVMKRSPVSRTSACHKAEGIPQVRRADVTCYAANRSFLQTLHVLLLMHCVCCWFFNSITAVQVHVSRAVNCEQTNSSQRLFVAEARRRQAWRSRKQKLRYLVLTSTKPSTVRTRWLQRRTRLKHICQVVERALCLYHPRYSGRLWFAPT